MQRVLSLLAPEHFAGAAFEPADYRNVRLACKDGAVAVARCVSSVTVTVPEDAPLAARAFPCATDVRLYGAGMTAVREAFAPRLKHLGAFAARSDNDNDDGEGVSRWPTLETLSAWTGGRFRALDAPRLRHLATDMRILNAGDAVALAACDLPLLEDLELESIYNHETASVLLTYASWPALRRLSLRVDDPVADHPKCTALGVIIASANFPRLQVRSRKRRCACVCVCVCATLCAPRRCCLCTGSCWGLLAWARWAPASGPASCRWICG
jgi:hypothetical protein